MKKPRKLEPPRTLITVDGVDRVMWPGVMAIISEAFEAAFKDKPNLRHALCPLQIMKSRRIDPNADVPSNENVV